MTHLFAQRHKAARQGVNALCKRARPNVVTSTAQCFLIRFGCQFVGKNGHDNFSRLTLHDCEFNACLCSLLLRVANEVGQEINSRWDVDFVGLVEQKVERAAIIVSTPRFQTHEVGASPARRLTHIPLETDSGEFFLSELEVII